MNKKILIVDDEPAMISMLSEFLGGAGFEISTASDGQMALEKVNLAPPDLLLMDIMLPKVDGWLVCQKLKADEKFKKIPIVLISGMLASDSSTDPSIEKCDYLIAKPFQMENLLKKVQELTGSS